MIEILQANETILRRIARPVQKKEIGGRRLKKIIADMKAALASQADGVAIAAPQIGVSLRLFVVSGNVVTPEGSARRDDLVFINPELVKLSREKRVVDEGCLSIRPIYGEVRRSVKATIRAVNEHGARVTVGGSGLLAQIFQHEVDHLEGILFIDKAKNLREIPSEPNAHDAPPAIA